MVQTAKRLQEAGVRTAILDISTLGGGISTPEAWFFGFLDELAIQLGLDEDIDTWWEAHANHNAVQRFSNFLRDVLLPKLTGPIVVFVDELILRLEWLSPTIFLLPSGPRITRVRATRNSSA